MEDTTSKKKSKVPLVFGGAILIVVAIVAGVFFWSSVVQSPYQKRLAEIQSCIENKLGMKVVYTKEFMPDFLQDANYPMTQTAELVFIVADAKSLSKKRARQFPPEFWRNYQVDCNFNQGAGNSPDQKFVRAFLADLAKLSKASQKPFYVVDTFDEAKGEFDEKPFKEKEKNARLQSKKGK